jgi:hypothetical protein
MILRPLVLHTNTPAMAFEFFSKAVNPDGYGVTIMIRDNSGSGKKESLKEFYVQFHADDCLLLFFNTFDEYHCPNPRCHLLQTFDYSSSIKIAVDIFYQSAVNFD